MRNATLVLAILLTLVASGMTPAQALEKFDPYPWCAVYGGRGGGGTNCGFLTLAQCRATVSGIGGSCEPNQFYNPRPSKRSRKKQTY
jgi:Protein of unknown function (DUF3551)